MRLNSWQARARWPAPRAFEGLEALAVTAGLSERATAGTQESTLPVDGAGLARHGAQLGVEVEAVRYSRADALSFLRGAAPAIVPFAGEFLLLARARWGSAHLLAPDGQHVRVGLKTLAAALHSSSPAASGESLERTLQQAGLSEREQSQVLSALGRQHADQAANTAFLLRDLSAAPWSTVLRGLRLKSRLAFVLGLKLCEQLCWILSWMAIGHGALAGRLELGWLAAWALLLAAMVPAQTLCLHSAARLAVDLGAELRRRLMAGALRIPSESLRTSGVGQSLGRVLESEALENLALGGGFQALFAGIELFVGVGVLALGASPLAQLAALGAWLALALVLGRRYLAARRVWSAERLSMTHDLVEVMVGHSTRLAQAERSLLHAREDRALADNCAASRAMDRAFVAWTGWIPRGFVLIGLACLIPTFFSSGSEQALALSIGGVLLLQRALRQMVDGLSELVGARIAWEIVQPLLQAAETAEELGDGALSAARSAERLPALVPVLRAEHVAFRHANRAEAVLNGCSLHIQANEKIVLEGCSGSGKSTLVAILGGLRAPDAGLVLASGLDRHTLGEAGWRRNVALAPQFHENHIFGGTLIFNLLMGRAWPVSPADIADAERMCERLGLAPLLARMPGGILQLVGETGWRLSHGERARVFLARALLQGAPAVLIDEGLETLDPESLARVQDVLLEEKAAVLVVAHP